MRVAFQGELGAFSEQAVRALVGAEAETLPCHALRDVFTAVEAGEAERGVIPVENSRAGTIRESYDLLFEFPLRITGEVAVRVEQCLLAPPGQTLDRIRRVYSHPQALAQCEAFVRELGAEAIAVYDTAGSAASLARSPEPGSAAIASAAAAGIYGLEILAQGIQRDPDNTTRFYVVGPASAAVAPGTGDDRTVVALALPDDNHPGSLFWCLGTLAFWRVNLLKIESRPSGRRPWHYLFYLELAAGAEDPGCRSALAELRTRTSLLRVLGSFPARPHP